MQYRVPAPEQKPLTPRQKWQIALGLINANLLAASLIFLTQWLMHVDASLSGIYGISATVLIPLLMGFTMFAQQKLSPANPDPMQQRIFLMMPIIFTFMMANFPAGLVIYWTWSNLLTITQQWFIIRRHNREA